MLAFYIITVAASIWVAGLVVLPVTRWVDAWPANASNTPFRITMRRGLPVPGAVWAQEYWEAHHAWRWLPVHVGLTALGRITPAWAGWTRAREIMGHEVEVWAEHALIGGDPASIRARESVALSGYPAFEGYRPRTIETEMSRRERDAQRFVSAHIDSIRKVQEAS